MKIHKPAAIVLAAVFMSGGALPVVLAQPAAQQKTEPGQPPQTRPRTTTTDEKPKERSEPDETSAPPQSSPQRVGAPANTRSGRPKDGLEPDDMSAPPRPDVPVETLANRQEGMSEEEAAILPYYNSFLSSYRIGPEDVISITVFGPYQERYSRSNITVPPNGVISHQLLPDGLFVGGKTTKQVQDDLTELLDEYIIDPKITVSLDKAQSAAFAVFGDVAQPGVRVMSRRLSVLDALALSGGVLRTGNKKKVVLFRRKPGNFIERQYIDVAAIEKGKRPDDTFLVPGDQLVVTGNLLKKVETILGYVQTFSIFRIFTGGF